MATYWVPDLPDIKSFAGCLWRSILILANSPSSTWSSKHINMLGRVCGLLKCFLNIKPPNIMKSDWGNLFNSELPWEPIFFVATSLRRRLSYDIPFTGKHEPNKLTCSHLCDFVAQLVRALHQHHRAHGFESRWVTWIFQVHETIA